MEGKPYTGLKINGDDSTFMPEPLVFDSFGHRFNH